jgi:hypothetical protein
VRILLFILCFTWLTSSAQVFNPGLILGISGAQIEGDGHGGYDKIGFIAGGFVNTDLSEKLSTQFEIYFINKGSFNAQHPDKGDYDSFKVNLNYIEIPVSLRYKHKKIMFEVGLYLGKLIGTPTLSDESGEIFVTQFPFKSFDFGGLLGIYYQLNEHFLLNLRSKNSLIPIRDFPSLDQQNGLFNTLIRNGWYNVDLNFSIRYQFGE